MLCKYCIINKSVKSGFDRKNNQRYRCKVCGKTFVRLSREDDKAIKMQNMRLLIHLILEGFGVSQLSDWTGIPERAIIRHRRFYLKKWREIVEYDQDEHLIASEIYLYAQTEERLLPGRVFNEYNLQKKKMRHSKLPTKKQIKRVFGRSEKQKK